MLKSLEGRRLVEVDANHAALAFRIMNHYPTLTL